MTDEEELGNNMRKTLINVLIIFVLLSFPIAVLAKNIRAGIELDSKEVTRDGRVNVTIKIKDAAEEDMSVFQTVIAFDERYFEGIDEDSFEAHSGWMDYTYNKETHALIIINKFGSKLSEEILSFDLKVKEKVKPTTTSITLKNSVVANRDKEIAIDDVSSKVNISVPSSEVGSVVEGKEYYGKVLEGSQVRMYNILIIIVLELIIATILVMLYYSSRLYIKNSNHRKMVVAGLCIVELFAIAAMFGYEVDRGDLTGDRNLDFTDVALLKSHLVNSEMLSPLKLANADMNKDGKLTCQDLAILLDKTLDKLEYMAILTDSLMESNGYEKGSVFDLRFSADTTDDLKIEYVLIDGKKYKAERIEGSNEYTVKVEASKESKKHNYNVTEVILETGKSIKVDYKTEVMVLKDVPKLTGFATNYNKEESKVNIALTLEDADHAIVDARYELVRSDGYVAESGHLDAGKNQLTFKLENAKSYKFKLKVNYNRGADSGEYLGIINDSYDIKIVTDYRLQIGNLNLMQEGTVVENLKKGTETTLTFYSTNVSGYRPQKVMVNGVLYSVSNLGGNRFAVKIPNDVILQGNNLTISKVILSNGKVILTNEKKSYNTLRAVPIIAEVKPFEDIAISKMNIDVVPYDVDGALQKLRVELYDGNNELLSSKIIEDGQYSMALDTIRDTDKYTIRVYGDYCLLDGNGNYQFENVLLSEQKVDAIRKVYLKNYHIDQMYPEKNATVTLSYEIASNYIDNVEKIVVNNVIYDARKVGVDTYEVEIDVGEDDGVQEMRTSKIIFASGFEYVVDEVLQIDVLKEIPVIDNFEIVENKQESKIDLSFDLFDKDGAYVSGKLQLIERETGAIKYEEDIILGKNTAMFELENAVKYDIRIAIDAILDTESLEHDSPNKLVDYELKKIEARIITDYKLDIVSIDTYKENENTATQFFHKGEKVKVEFVSTNVTEYYPTKVKIDGVTYDVSTVNGVSRFFLDGFASLGSETIRFESIVLSNHVELVVNSTKKIEIVKDAPLVTQVDIEKSDENIKVTLNVEDADYALSNMKAVVTDDTGQVVFDSVVEKNSPVFTFTKGASEKYSIQVLASYNLSTLGSEGNEVVDGVLFEKEIDLAEKYFEFENVDAIVVETKDTEEPVVDLNLIDLERLEAYEVKLTMKDGEAILYGLEKIKRIEEAFSLVLKTEEWIKYNPGKWSNKLIIEYGAFSLKEDIELPDEIQTTSKE